MPKVIKTCSIDSEIYRQWEEIKKEQGEDNLSKGIENAMRREIKDYEQGKQHNNTQAISSVDEEFSLFEKERITPILDKQTEITMEEGQQLHSLIKALGRVADRIKLALKLSKRVVFVEVPKYDKLEQIRLAGRKTVYEYREQTERFELMQALPVTMITDADSNLRQPQTEAEFISLAKSEEMRKERLHDEKQASVRNEHLGLQGMGEEGQKVYGIVEEGEEIPED